MVKKMVVAFSIVVVLILLAAKLLALQSQKMPAGLGLTDGRLSICPNASNCVCSERPVAADRNFVAPIKIQVPDHARAWQALHQAVEKLGGDIVASEDHYLHATFSSAVFHYVDDLEARLDEVDGLIHLRSASRVGRSDFGMNRKRVERLKAEWTLHLKQ